MLATWGCTTFSKPTLDLQFVGATSLDNRITFTRASTATYFDEDGILQSALANVPRIDFNPSTLVCNGLLIEEQRTNSILQSENFSTTWVATNASITTNVTTAPDGTTTADKLTEALDVNSVHQVAQTSVTVMSSATYTASVYAKADTRTRVRIAFIVGATGGVFADANLTSGTIGAASSFGGGTAVTSAIQSVGNGWFRILITGSGPAGTSGELRCELLDATGNRQYNGDGTSGLFIWGAQLEAGAFATSYIPTTTTALTRNADVASMTGTNFSSWYNASEGTLFAQSQTAQAYAAGVPARVSIDDGTISNRIAMRNGNNFSSVVTVSGSPVASLELTAWNSNITKQAIAYKVDDFAYTTNGASVVTDTSGAIPSVNRLGIGLTGTQNFLNGYIQRIAYYPVRLANTTLQALTA